MTKTARVEMVVEDYHGAIVELVKSDGYNIMEHRVNQFGERFSWRDGETFKSIRLASPEDTQAERIIGCAVQRVDRAEWEHARQGWLVLTWLF